MTSDDFRTGDSAMEDSELDGRLNALTRVVDPAPANWDAIERRIRRRRRPHAIWAGIAAAAVLGGVALVVSQIGPAPAPAGGIAETLHAEAQAMRASAPELPVVSEFDSPAALMAAWQDNQQAIAQLEQALEHDPDNRTLLEFLTEARMRQARLVRSIGRNQTPTNERSMNL